MGLSGSSFPFSQWLRRFWIAVSNQAQHSYTGGLGPAPYSGRFSLESLPFFSNFSGCATKASFSH
jgi:hypothetical protein